MNKTNFDYLAYWINERHRIFLKKEAGEPKPWTHDRVLQQWKFCNPFRQNDRQTRLLQQHVIQPHWNDDPADLLWNIFAFRAFNWHETYQKIGWQSGKDLDVNYMMMNLRNAAKKGGKITSGAYMIRGMEGKPKWQSIPETLEKIWEDKEVLAETIRLGTSDSMEETQEFLLSKKYWGWGPFTCYQVVLDLLHSPILEHAKDVNDWCVIGPGAEKGLRLIWRDIKPSEMLEATKGLLEVLPEHLEPHVPPINLQDVEFSLCELGKYLRILNGGKSKERYAGA